MIDFILKYANLILANWEKVLIGGVCTVAAVIVFFGMIKGFVEKIPNKKLKKFVKAFGSLILVLPATAGTFAIEQISFDHYWVGVVLNTLGTIVGYWVYEHTFLRDFIQFIGENTLKKFWAVFVEVIKSSIKNSKDKKIISQTELLQEKENKPIKKSDPTDLSNF